MAARDRASKNPTGRHVWQSSTPQNSSSHDVTPQSWAPHYAAPHGTSPYAALPNTSSPYGTSPYDSSSHGSSPYATSPYSSAPSVGQPQWPGAGGQQLQRPVPEQGKSYPITWILSLLLGIWGVDRFYLGKWKTGLLKLFTTGGFLVWWVIDLIVLTRGRTRDAKGRELRQFETIKWPSRMISGVAVVGLFGLLVLGGTVEVPEEPETQAIAAEAALEDSATSTPAERSTASPPTPEEDAPAEGTVLAQLAGLEQKGRSATTDYVRELFGWRDDMDRNGCDTRNDILRRDLTQITFKEGTNGCVVLTGTLLSPYSGSTIEFDRSASTIDIDHVVALADAWQTGASTWDEETMREFANDPLNLLGVESSLNQQKGAGDAATWLPPKKDYRCEYVARQIAVKAKYGLWVKPAEAEAMERVLEDCEGLMVSDAEVTWPAAGEGDVVVVPASKPTSTPEPTEAPSMSPSPKPAPGPVPLKSSAPTQSPAPKKTSAPTKAPAPKKTSPPTRAPAPTKAPAVKRNTAPKTIPPKSAQQEGSTQSGGSGGSVYYKNCTAAREAGAAPVRHGDPGYAKHLDRDGDGVGCE